MALSIDRSALFDPAAFLGEGWSIWRGPADGNGLEGEPEQDARALSISALNAEDFLFDTAIVPPERWVKGEAKLPRLRATGKVLLDAQIAQALYEEAGQQTLNEIMQKTGVSWFDLPGTVLRDREGYRYLLGVYFNDGKWPWYPHWLENNWRASRPSALYRGTIEV